MMDKTLAVLVANLKRAVGELKALKKFIERQGTMLNIDFQLAADTSSGYGDYGCAGVRVKISTTYGSFLPVLTPLLARKEEEIGGLAQHIARMKEMMTQEEVKAQAKELKENKAILTAVMKAVKP